MNDHLPAIAHVLTVAEVLAAALGITRWSRLDRPCRFIVGWLIVSAISDVAAIWMFARYGDAHPVYHLRLPLTTLLVLSSLAAMQTVQRKRDVLRLVALFFTVAWGVLMLVVEDVGSFPIVTTPLAAILLCGSAAFAIGEQVRRARTPLFDDSSFLVAVALLVYFAPTSFVSMVANYLAETGATETLALLATGRRLVVLPAFALVARAFIVTGSPARRRAALPA